MWVERCNLVHLCVIEILDFWEDALLSRNPYFIQFVRKPWLRRKIMNFCDDQTNLRIRNFETLSNNHNILHYEIS